MPFLYLSQCLKPSVSKFVFQQPPESKEPKPAAPEKKAPEGDEKFVAAITEKIKKMRAAGKSPEEIQKLLDAEVPKLTSQVSQNEKLTEEQRKMLDSLLRKYIEEKKQEVAQYLEDTATKIEARATEVSHQVGDLAGKAAKVAGIGALALIPGVNVIAGTAYAGYKGYQAIKESGYQEAKAKFDAQAKSARRDQMATLEALASSSDSKVAQQAKSQLESLKAVDDNEKKLAKAVAYAKEAENDIDDYVGSDLDGKFHDEDEVEEATAGAIAAAYMLEGEAGAKAMRESLKSKEPKKGALREDGLIITDVQWAVNDYNGAGRAHHLGEYQKEYSNVSVGARTFATMYLSKAYKTEGMDEKTYEAYKSYVERKLKMLSSDLGNDNARPDELHSAFMVGMLTPEQFLKVEGKAEEKEAPEVLAKRRDEMKKLRATYDSFKGTVKGQFTQAEFEKLDPDAMKDEEVTEEKVTQLRTELQKGMQGALHRYVEDAQKKYASVAGLLEGMTTATAGRMAPMYAKLAAKLKSSYAESDAGKVFSQKIAIKEGDLDAMVATAKQFNAALTAHGAWENANANDMKTLQEWYAKNKATIDKWEAASGGKGVAKPATRPAPAPKPKSAPKEKEGAPLDQVVAGLGGSAQPEQKPAKKASQPKAKKTGSTASQSEKPAPEAPEEPKLRAEMKEEEV